MCHQQIVSWLHDLLKKMAKLQSPRVQCCMCAVSVMSALLGMFVLSAGVCLVLNYNFLEVDTSGLPPNLHNEEGKKVVGIILICVGIAALGISGLVSVLFYTACSRSDGDASASSGKEERGENGGSRPSSEESAQGRHGHYHSNGITQVRGNAGAVPRRAGVVGAGAGAGAMSNGRRGNDPRSRGPPGSGKDGGPAAYSKGALAAPGVVASTRPHRSGKKNHRHVQSRFRNSLPSHPEEAGAEPYAGMESRHSAPFPSRHLAFPERTGHVNKGAQLDDDLVLTGGNVGSSVTPSVVIKVDSSYLNDKTSASQTTFSKEESNTDTVVTQHSTDGGTSVEGASAIVVVDLNDNSGFSEGPDSDKVSRSTLDSLDTAEGKKATESPALTQKQLQDDQMETELS